MKNQIIAARTCRIPTLPIVCKVGILHVAIYLGIHSILSSNW